MELASLVLWAAWQTPGYVVGSKLVMGCSQRHHMQECMLVSVGGNDHNVSAGLVHLFATPVGCGRY